MAFLVDDKRRAKITRAVYAKASDASVRLVRTPLAGPIAAFRDAVARSVTEIHLDEPRHWATAVPHNALQRQILRSRRDVVVANSVERWAWWRMSALYTQLQYVRHHVVHAHH